MSIGINELTRSFLGKDSLNDCSIGELQNLAKEFPFFSTIPLLLAKKTMGQPEGSDYAEKASLYFPDPLWLDILLHEKGTFDVEKMLVEQVEQKEPTRVFEPAFTAESTVAIADLHHNNTSPGVMKKEGPPQSESDTMIEDTPEEKKSFPESSPEENGNGTQLEIPGGKDEQNDEAIDDDIALSPEEDPPPPVLPDEIHETIMEDAAKSIPEERPEMAEASTDQSKGPLNLDEQPAIEKKMEWKFEPVSPGSGELSFEPFHTVDYFASQGIKFSEEEKPKDKFGQQLKSFTEWLKLLKQPQGAETIPATIPADKKVEKLAEHSLAEREVLTEAMAQVWEKQGNRDKALAIYKKLSLLNPSKSSYFAAKIELLKKS